MPINLIKSRLYKLSGTSGTSGTKILRNTRVLGEVGYFYKNIGLSRKVRSSRPPVPPHRKNHLERAKMICNDTHGFFIIIGEDRVGIGDADAGG